LKNLNHSNKPALFSLVNFLGMTGKDSQDSPATIKRICQNRKCGFL